MKEIRFNKEKNEQLKKSRGIGFEEIIEATNAGRIVKTIDHPNQKKIPKAKNIFNQFEKLYLFSSIYRRA